MKETQSGGVKYNGLCPNTFCRGHHMVACGKYMAGDTDGDGGVCLEFSAYKLASQGWKYSESGGPQEAWAGAALPVRAPPSDPTWVHLKRQRLDGPKKNCGTSAGAG